MSMAAFDAAGDPERFPDAGAPWQPLKLYYFMTFNKERVAALHEAVLARGLDSPYQEWLDRWADEPDDSNRITTRITCGEFFPVRNRALLSHATQVDPDGFWFLVPIEVQQAAWPTEDYELARSLIDSPLPEDDLFAGVRESLCRRGDSARQSRSPSCCSAAAR